MWILLTGLLVLASACRFDRSGWPGRADLRGPQDSPPNTRDHACTTMQNDYDVCQSRGYYYTCSSTFMSAICTCKK